MQKKWGIASCLFLFQGAFALQEAPWLGNVYEFEFHTDFCYSQYAKIDRAIEQPSYAYNNYVTDASLSLTASPKIDVEIELDMARTPHQTYGFRSAAFQIRYLFLDDIVGDLVTFNMGLNTRAVTGRAVADVSSPYASYWNGEATVSIGKEFTRDEDWKTRGYALGSVGLANHGSFWNRYKAAYEARIGSYQALEVFSVGYFGYGGEKRVNIDQFRGWGFIQHRSIDVGAKYRYLFQFWGSLSVSYACRVWAVSYPEREQSIEFSYSLPFSIL